MPEPTTTTPATPAVSPEGKVMPNFVEPSSSVGKLFAQGMDLKFESSQKADAKPAEPKAAEPKATEPKAAEPKAAVAPVENPEPTVTEPTEPKATASVRPTAKDFRLVKEAKDAVEKKAAALEAEKAQLAAQLQELQTKLSTAVPADYDDIRKQNEELSATLERVSVESSPRFVREFDAPMKAELDRLRADVAGVEGFDVEGLVRAIQQPDGAERSEKLNEYLGNLNGVQLGRVNLRIAKFDERRDAKAEALKSHKEWKTALTQKEQAAAIENQKNNLKVIDSVIDLGIKKVPYLQKIEGNDAHNAGVDAVIKEARSMWSESQTPQTLAQVTLAGVLAPRVYAHAQQLFAENQALKKQIADMKSATAPVRSGDAEGTPPAPKNIMELFRRGVNSSS